MAQQFALGVPEELIARGAGSGDLERWWAQFPEFFRNEPHKAQNLVPEVSLSAPLGNARLVAKYDLLAGFSDGLLRIYDWKTYRKRPRDEWLAARWQTRVYRSLLVRAGGVFDQREPVAPERVEMVYWFANFPTEPARFPFSAAQFERDWAALEALATEISAAAASLEQREDRFPLTEDQQRCAYCPYRSYCARGVQAGDLEGAQVEPEAEDTFDLDFEQIGEIAF
jgi:hypothetical protein